MLLTNSGMMTRKLFRRFSITVRSTEVADQPLPDNQFSGRDIGELRSFAKSGVAIQESFERNE